MPAPTREKRKNPHRLPRIIKRADWTDSPWRISRAVAGDYGATWYEVTNRKTGAVFEVDPMAAWSRRMTPPAGVPAYVVAEIGRQDAIDRLRAILRGVDTLYTSIASASRSGMSRHIKVYALRKPGPEWLAGYAARALDWPLTSDDGVRVDGCGMDMGFHLVYSLSSVLFGNGYALKQRWL
ncbi:MAG: hypothetical protein WC700_14470 [Gemmatimonadaceae bacterium]|jgi:hypothetical protein